MPVEGPVLPTGGEVVAGTGFGMLFPAQLQ